MPFIILLIKDLYNTKNHIQMRLKLDLWQCSIPHLWNERNDGLSCMTSDNRHIDSGRVKTLKSSQRWWLSVNIHINIIKQKKSFSFLINFCNHETNFELSNESVRSDNVQCCDTKDSVGVVDAMFLHYFWCDGDSGVHLKSQYHKYKLNGILTSQLVFKRIINLFIEDMS